MKRRDSLSAVLAVLFVAGRSACAQGVSPQDLAQARADLGSRPTVATISPGCLKPSFGGRVTVQGLNLGASQGGRSAVFTLSGRRMDASVASWTNGRIELDVRPFNAVSPGEAAPIAFEIRSEAGTAYPGASKELHVCRTRFEQTITFDLGVCSSSPPSLRFVVQRPPSPGEFVTATGAGPGRYQARTAFVEGSWMVSPDRISECPDGHWEPSLPTLHVDDARWQQTLAFRWVTPIRRATVPASTITTFVKTALSGTAIHLNNYGPKSARATSSAATRG